MLIDVGRLASAVVPIAGGLIVLIAGPNAAVQLGLRGSRPLPYQVPPSSALTNNAVAAVAPRGLVFSINPEPDISVSAEALLHMSDATLGIVPDNGTIADPTRSLYQTAALAILLHLEVTWARRSDSAAALLTGATWAAA